MPRLIAPESLDEFNTAGATVLRGVFSDWVETLRAGVAANMEDPDPMRGSIVAKTAAGGSLLITATGIASRNTRISSTTRPQHRSVRS